MTPEAVSDIFAFVCSNAEFSKSILFAETEVPEIQPDERDAINAVLEHVRGSVIGLLGACRQNMHDRADAELQVTMGRNWNRDTSISDRRQVVLPLLIESSYVEAAYFWIDEEPRKKGRLSLLGEIWVQKRRQMPLLVAAAGPLEPAFLTDTPTVRVVEDITEGKRFSDLARSVVDPLWDLAVNVRSALIAESARESQGGRANPGADG